MSATGYSTELYDTIAGFGLHRGASILDVGCGDGIAVAPFAQNGFPVTCVDPSPQMLAAAKQRLPNAEVVQGAAESLPFPDERFDVVISAQAVHTIDRARATAEMHRVLRKGGLMAIWWKQLMAQEGVKEMREQIFAGLGVPVPPEGLSGGFKEFYASELLRDQTLRVLPWRTSLTVSEYMENERSMDGPKSALGKNVERYYEQLERRLRERAGEGDPIIALAYVQYVYLAKKR